MITIDMITIEGRIPKCVKCYSYRIYKGNCDFCGTNQLQYERKLMVNNLLRYGFKQIKPPFIITLFNKIFNKKTLPKWQYGSVIATHIDDSANMKFHIDDDEVIFDNHGDYFYIESALDKVLKNKQIQRQIKLSQLLDS